MRQYYKEIFSDQRQNESLFLRRCITSLKPRLFQEINEETYHQYDL
jgi:hypothetical protein